MKKDIGRVIVGLRNAHGWSQEVLANKMGVLLDDVQELEAGKKLTLALLDKSARALNVKISFLFQAAGL